MQGASTFLLGKGIPVAKEVWDIVDGTDDKRGQR
jgi:hypothetical protein